MHANLQGPENLMHCDNCINWEGDLVRPAVVLKRYWTLLGVTGRYWTLLEVTVGSLGVVSTHDYSPTSPQVTQQRPDHGSS